MMVVFDCGQKRQSLAHFLDQPEKHSCPLASGLFERAQGRAGKFLTPTHSITSSAIANEADGTLKPSALAVFTLIRSVGFSSLENATGMDAELAIGIGETEALQRRPRPRRIVAARTVLP
jgi:hypothetical protein